MAGNITIHILGDTANFMRAMNRTQAKLSSLRMAFDDLNKGARIAAMGIAAVAAGGIGAGAVAGGVLAGGFLAAAGAVTMLAMESERVSKAFDETKLTWSSLAAEFTEPMHDGLIAFFGRLTDAFKAMGPSITRISKQMTPFLEQLGDRLIPVAEKLGGMLEKAFEAGKAPINAMVDGIGILADGFGNFFETLDSEQTASFITKLFETISLLLPVLATLINALLPVGIAILDALKPAFETLTTFINTSVVPILNKISAWLKENPKFITQLIVALVAFKIAIGAISAVLGILAIAQLAPFIAMLLLLGAVLLPIAGDIKAMLMPAFDYLKVAIEAIKEPLAAFTKQMQGHVMKVIDQVVRILPALIDLFFGLLRALMPVIDAIAGVFVMALGHLTDLFLMIVPIITDFAKQLGERLTRFIHENKDAIEQAVINYKEFIATLIDAAKWIGDLILKVVDFVLNFEGLIPLLGAVAIAFTAFKVVAYAVKLAMSLYRGVMVLVTAAKTAFSIAVGIAEFAMKAFNVVINATKWAWQHTKLVASKLAFYAKAAAIGVAELAMKAFNIALAATQWVAAKAKMVAFAAGRALFVVATGAMAAAQWVLNASVMGFPLIWIIAAVIAVIAAIWLIVKNWDTITA